MTRASHANFGTPIIGDSSTMRVGLRIARSFDRVERILQHQRAAVRIPDQHERLVRADPRAEVACGDAHRGQPVLPRHVGQAGRHGAVSGHAERHDVVPAPAEILADACACCRARR